MVQSILVPLDGSSFAEHALPLALTIARRARARVRLLMVHVPLLPAYAKYPTDYHPVLDPHVKERETTYLKSVVDRIKAAVPVEAAWEWQEGGVVDVIDKDLAAGNADLVVMSTHGRGPMSRFWLGSVADELMRRAAVPLLLVRPQELAADLRSEVMLRRVMVPLDGSPLAEQIIEPSIALGNLMEAEVTLLRVIRSVAPLSIEYVHTPLTPEAQHWLAKLRDLHEQDVKQSRDYLEKVRPRINAPQVTTLVKPAEQVAPAILEEAASQAGTLIALATHGRHGLPRLFLGSVADKVIRGATTPVMVYRPRSK